MNPLNPKKIGAIVTAYTGIMCGDIKYFMEYASDKMGHEVMHHHLADYDFKRVIKEKSTDDFHDMHRWCGGK